MARQNKITSKKRPGRTMTCCGMALLTTLSGALVACGVGPEPNSGARYEAFVDASAESGVPTEVLLAVSYEATRWETPRLDTRIASEGPPRFGVMGLSEAQVAIGAERLGLTYDEIIADTAANIRAGGAALAAEAETLLGENFAENQVLADWRDVLAAASGMPDQIAIDYADEVMRHASFGASRTLESGEVIELIGSDTLPPVLDGAEENPYGRSSQALSASSSLVDQVRPASSSNYSRGRSRGVDRIVIHTVQGSYNGCISWFQNPSARVSAHYVVRSRDGQITQMVAEGDTAWHVRSANSRAIGIEHEGYVSDPAWYTDAMYRRSAALVCNIATRNGLPLDRAHIVAHSEVPGNDHSDPGRNWDWGKYMRLVKEACGQGGGSSSGGSTGSSGGSTGSSGGSTGSSGGNTGGNSVRLQGIIYRAPSRSARISGATVKVAGKTVHTNGNGYYSVNVPSGTHRITASATGYVSRSIERAVSTGTWGSIGLPVASSTGGGGSGQVVGVVYAAPDSSARIAGARVTLSDGKSATTNSVGYFAFTVSSGTYTVTASRAGFVTASVRRQVRAGQKAWGSVGLARERQPQSNGRLVGVVYAAPNTGDRLAGASVSLSSGASTTANSNGVFSFDVAPGTYRVTASAAGYTASSVTRTVASGREIWGSVGLSRAAAPGGTGSLIGVVYASPSSGSRISGASVWTSTGQSTVTGSDGVYTLSGVPAGPVQIFASASGFRDGSAGRVVQKGKRTWGSVPLTRVDAAAGAEGGVDGVGTVIQGGSGSFDPDFLLISPRDNEAVGATPTFTWEAATSIDPALHSYVLAISDGPDDANVTLFDVAVEPGAEMSFVLPEALHTGDWGWIVVVVDAEGKQVQRSDVTGFLVQ